MDFYRLIILTDNNFYHLQLFQCTCGRTLSIPFYRRSETTGSDKRYWSDKMVSPYETLIYSSLKKNESRNGCGMRLEWIK